MSKPKVIISNQISGKNKKVSIGHSTVVQFQKGDTILIGIDEFPYTLELTGLVAIRKGDDLELVLENEGNEILVVEDYFLYATGNDISVLSNVNEATYLSLAEGGNLLSLPDQTAMMLKGLGGTYMPGIDLYESFEAPFEFFDTTTLITTGAALAGIGVYALTSSSDEDKNEPVNEGIVFAPKELKAADISLVHVDKDDKYVNGAGKAGQINTLTPEIEGLKNSATITNEIVIELPNGKTFTTKVENDGSWYFKLPEGELKAGDKGVFKVYEKNSKGEKSKPVDVPFEIDVEKPKEFGKPYIDGAAEDGSVNTNTPIIRGEKAEVGAKVKIVSPTGSTHFVDVSSEGKWSFTLPDIKMTEGQKKEITVTIIDQAGNVGESFTLPVIKDTLPPVAPKLNPAAATDDVGPVKGVLNDKDWTDDAKPVFSGTGEAGMQLLVYVDGRKLTLKTPVFVDKNGQWSFEFETALGDGNRKIEFKLQDPAGNISQSTPAFSLNIDTVKLTKLVISEIYVKSDGASVSNGGEVTSSKPVLMGSANDNIGKIMIYHYDSKNKTGVLLGETNVTYGKWSFDLAKESLTLGVNDIKLVPISKAGNEMTLEEAPNMIFTYQEAPQTLQWETLTEEYESLFLNTNLALSELESNALVQGKEMQNSLNEQSLLTQASLTIPLEQTSIEYHEAVFEHTVQVSAYDGNQTAASVKGIYDDHEMYSYLFLE